ncbi:MAG: hypothetical protein HQK81_12310 [Desulfovibrionaceae bacterium]|nr:hypothetical protein [Desulfovibrionaceae bacterium]MBF0514826.1 hypothetical protein [Desulfovibrionaceae bacterium]
MALKLNLTEERKFWAHIDGALWYLKPLTRSEERALIAKYTERKRQGGEWREVLSDEYFPSRAKKIILDFKGITGADGKDVSRSDFAIEQMCELHHELVLRVLSEASATYAASVEDEEKNFDAGASGKQPAPKAKP